jgi:hypothetical protein
MHMELVYIQQLHKIAPNKVNKENDIQVLMKIHKRANKRLIILN